MNNVHFVFILDTPIADYEGNISFINSIFDNSIEEDQISSIQTKRRTRKTITLNEDEEKTCKKRTTRKSNGKRRKTDEAPKSVKTKKPRKRAMKDEIGLLLDNNGLPFLSYLQ